MARCTKGEKRIVTRNLSRQNAGTVLNWVEWRGGGRYASGSVIA